MKKEKQKKEKINNELNKKKQENNKKNTYHKYLWYLVIFSLVGLLVETIVCFTQKQIYGGEFGLLLGPLCIIYGIGAIITIVCLDRYKGKNLKLFILGTLLGVVIEYVMNFILEATLGARLWNCTWAKFNINGRVCLEFAILWGIMTIILINIIKKYIDIVIDKIQGKTRIIVDIITTVILILTVMLTMWGVITYTIRARETLNGKNYTSNNNIFEKFQNTVFSNNIMEKIFKELEITDNEGNTILVKNING